MRIITLIFKFIHIAVYSLEVMTNLECVGYFLNSYHILWKINTWKFKRLIHSPSQTLYQCKRQSHLGAQLWQLGLGCSKSSPVGTLPTHLSEGSCTCTWTLFCPSESGSWQTIQHRMATLIRVKHTSIHKHTQTDRRAYTHIHEHTQTYMYVYKYTHTMISIQGNLMLHLAIGLGN